MKSLSTRPVIAAQFSTVHSQSDRLQPPLVLQYLERFKNAIPIDILIIGWEEKPDLFKAMTSPKTRPINSVFLWYPFLSDYPQMQSSHLVENIDGGKSTGWDGYKGTQINESFRQTCPNNPHAVSTALEHLERLLTHYDFDGVFIDKIRFPSMVNGWREVFSCFCPFCQTEAARSGLDLSEVKRVLNTRGGKSHMGFPVPIPPGARWLENLLHENPIIQQFVQFRAQSIEKLVGQIHALTTRLNKQLSLDVFSPCLAPLVGQDYLALSRYADWIKPMIYRFGNGPSSLRSEIPALVNELGDYLGLETSKVYQSLSSRIDGLHDCSFDELKRAAPLNLIKAETITAKKILSDTPVYLGLETVNIPGKMGVSPSNVQEILDVGKSAGVDGFVLSWDLYHTPLENVTPINALIN